MSAPLCKENLRKFVIEVTSTINNLLEENFKSSQRLKLLCYDVSSKYIIFGANNGSIHIYRRKPAVAFLKIIPSKSSSAIFQVEISPKEKHILVSDETGLLIILENCFEENNFHNHIHTEHKTRTITAMKWHNDSKAYIGDNHGTVSVISIPSLISFALMTTTYESLLDLDSPIIQIDCLSRFLLITTERRAFICDTEREMYKQIGRKNKGTLGSCFFHTYDVDSDTTENFENHKLYCSRPGLRMWQANFEGEVFYTHNYKDATPSINEVLRFGQDLIVETVNEPDVGTLGFGNVSLFDNKYLCVVNSKGFYLIDPEQNDLLFRYFNNREIVVKLIDNEIFIRDYTGRIKILNVYDIEDLMINLHKTRQYKAGIQFVVRYKSDVLTWSKYSPNIKLIVDLKDEYDDRSFNEILSELQAYERAQMIEYLKTDDPKIGTIEDNSVSTSSESVSEDESSETIQIMYKQYKLNETYDVEMPQFTEMLSELNVDEIIELFLNFAKYMEVLNEKLRMEWCYNKCLHHIQSRGFPLNNLKKQSIEFLTQSFLQVNKDTPTCTCEFPLPNRKKTPPKYDLIGRKLSEFTNIPYLWLHRITSLKTIREIEQNMALILQFGYFEILQNVQKEVTYDFCDNLLTAFVRLKTGNCLNCGVKFPDDYFKQIPNWEHVGLNLIKYVGPDNVLKLFLNRHEDIPNDELSEKFYTSCMFAKTRVGSNGMNYQSVDLACNLLESNDTQTEFQESISAFLMGKTNNSSIPMKLTCNSCTHCKHYLNHPILCRVEKLDCGHAFHAICLKYIKGICTVCFST